MKSLLRYEIVNTRVSKPLLEPCKQSFTILASPLQALI